jgi:hypothetical protein
MSKKKPTSPSPADLARALVFARFFKGLTLHFECLLSGSEYDDSVEVADQFGELIDAVLDADEGAALAPSARDFRCGIEGSKDADAMHALVDAHAQAGFLVGLELGRLMGGAR